MQDCQEELQSKTEELRSVLESSTIAENELREEAKLRKRYYLLMTLTKKYLNVLILLGHNMLWNVLHIKQFFISQCKNEQVMIFEHTNCTMYFLQTGTSHCQKWNWQWLVTCERCHTLFNELCWLFRAFHLVLVWDHFLIQLPNYNNLNISIKSSHSINNFVKKNWSKSFLIRLHDMLLIF